MTIRCTLIVNHRPRYLPGKYGLTIHRVGSGQSTANVRELSDDQELRKILADLDYSAEDVEETLADLAHPKADVKHLCLIEESKVAEYGF